MSTGTNFQIQDVEHRINLSSSHQKWQHFDGTKWSVFASDLSYTPSLRIALQIETHNLPDNFTWHAVGINAEVFAPFASATEKECLVISSNDEHSISQLKELLFSFLHGGVYDPDDVIETLERRRYLWGRQVGQMTSVLAQGLFGELYFMKHVLVGPIHEHVSHWDGPSGSLNDFNWPALNLHVEVKTSSKLTPPLVHIISSISQLDSNSGDLLFLFSMPARVDLGGPHSLTSLIEEIQDELSFGPDLSYLASFNQKLAEYGWNPDQEDFRFILNTDLNRVYHIRPGFPKLSQNEVGPLVDDRINVGSYEITMVGLQDFEMKVSSEIAPLDLCNITEY